MSSLYNQSSNNQSSNFIYNVGDCIEFKRFIPSVSNSNNNFSGPDTFEYTISNGKIFNNNNPDLLEVKIYSYDIDGFTNETAWVTPESIIRHYPKDTIKQLTPRIIIKDLWKDLVFREIKTVKVKDAEVITYDYINENGFVRTATFDNIETALRNVDINKHANVHTHFKDYFGFTTHRAVRNNDIYCNQEIFFSRKCYGELNLSGKNITGNFSLRRGFKTIPPYKRQYVCGLVELGEKGLFYRKWFICSEEFLTLWTMICEPDHYALKNKTDNGYVTKTFQELLNALDTTSYSLPYNILDVGILDVKSKYRSYNLETYVLYIPNIYQTIAKTLFTPNKQNTTDNLYKSYEERLKTDLTWMKK